MDQILAIMPAVNAVLISTSGLFIIDGVRSIKRKDQVRHKRDMLIATALATLFLILYVTRISLGGLTPFAGPASVRTIYLFILITHVGLAMIQTPLVLLTLYRAFTGRYPSHRAIARVTYPIWIYVSFTGVLVYGLLHYPYAP
jgi:putative membrane protein